MSCYGIFEMIICFIFGTTNDPKPECFIYINNDLPERQPLLLYPKARKGFIYPEEVNSGVIVIKAGESIHLACPGGRILLNTTKPYENAIFQCIENSLFLLEKESIQESINRIICDEHPRHIARKTFESCGLGITGEIGFVITNKDEEFYKIIDFCHNEQWSHTIYAHAKIPAVINAAEKNVPRSGFKKGEFFQGIAMNKIYSRKSQQETFAKIFNESLAYQYIQNSGNYYLARGHLIAKRDLFYAAQQRATFYYVNVVPMWQIINNGNWKKMEIIIRNYATDKNCDLEVWAGALGILELKDHKGNLKQIYLYYQSYKNKAIPVPKILFKVVYDNKSKAGIVFLMVNNPYLTTLTEDYIICENVCDNLDYISWDQNYNKGYSYCCDVNNFRNFFEYLPYFETNQLLI